ncbi:hypothetical protein IMZ08_00340 [Bacillus luteolus]|uniref:Uncharacterized protein n=1 Tax=Litchfieldia luteola TaxID=682179 RepID=A0ABR9QDC6_9BACI|nr:hypothetical protein [Cytobacillus luteolus]MBE4906503.1 hypothetical protein [Cytobacillus luteolus]MBP1941186.1 hypothetical protein [Cytobacillus luteolus]
MMKELLILTVDGSEFRGFRVELAENPIEDLFPEDFDAIPIRLTEATGPFEENQLVFIQQSQVVAVSLVKDC